MIPALFTSSSALGAAQTMLSVVGNNLANSDTSGFKSQTLLFSNQFSQVLAGASQPTTTSGGKNPVQVGEGVQVAATDTNLTQGTFQATGNPLDLALQGNGYFVMQNGNETEYTRAGSFAVDSSGILVDPATGAKVQRVGTIGEATPTTPAFQTQGDNDIVIPDGLTIPGSATQDVTFTGNLNADASTPIAQVMSMTSALTAGGAPATLNTSLDNLDQTNSGSGFVAGDVIQINGTRVDGTTISTSFTLTGNPTTDTVGSLLNTINQAFLSGTTATGATATLNSSGEIVLTANSPGVSNMSLSLSTPTTNPSGSSVAFPSITTTVTGAAGTVVTTTAQIYDAQGSAHNMTFSFQKVSANDWTVTASMNSADGTITNFGEDNTVAGISFNANGTLAGISGPNTKELMVTNNPYTVGGVAATLATPLQSLDQHTPAGTPYGATDSITISGTDFSGNKVSATLPAFDPVTGNPATVGDLINTINSTFKGGVATMDSSGDIEFTATQAGQTDLSLSVNDTTSNTGGSETAFSNFDVVNPGTTGSDTITFQAAGLAGFGALQTVALNLGTFGSSNGITQTGSASSVNVSKQDGYAQGVLQTVSVSTNGVITGEFTNGQAESIAQIALATFTNPGGLQNAGNNYLNPTDASGLPNVSAPGTGSAGTIQSGGLESSNVDVGTEFTQLIAAQQAYEVNAKAFGIANTIMTAAVNLIQVG